MTAEEIRELRLRFDESQEEFGMRFKKPVHHTMISRWENGLKPNVYQMAELEMMKEILDESDRVKKGE